MKKRIVAALLALVFLLGLVGTAYGEGEDAAALVAEGLGYWFGTGADGYDMKKAQEAFQKAVDLGSAGRKKKAIGVEDVHTNEL